MQLWFIYIIISAILITISTLIQKRLLSHVHALEFSASRALFNLFFSLFLIPFIDFSSFTKSALVLVYFNSIIFSAAFLFRNKAVRHLDLSESAPLSNLSPFFLLILAYFILGEKVTYTQFFGIVVLLLGVYIVEVDHSLHNLISPLKNFLKSKDIHHMVFAMVVLSIVQVFDKFILTNFTDAISYLALLWFFVCLNLCSLEIYRHGIKELKNDIIKQFKPLLLITIFGYPSNIFHLLSVGLYNVSLVIPVKRISTLLISIFGGTFFHEKGLKLRWIGGAITLLGVFLIMI